MEVFSVLITGTNRGLGLEFVRQFAHSAKPPKHIFATYRNKNAIQELKAIQESAPPETKVHLIQMDVSVPSEVEAARKVVEATVGDNGLTILINNAGVVQWMGYPDVTAENLLYHFNINTVGPILVAQAMLPLLKKAASRNTSPGMNFSKAAILNISSISGCIANVGSAYAFDLNAPAYKISKAALNMGMRVLAAVVKDENILVISMCPGWVKTDMGTDKAELTPQQSITAILETISNLNESHHGTYMNQLGEPYSW